MRKSMRMGALVAAILCFTGCTMAEQKVDLNDGIPDFEYLANESKAKGLRVYTAIQQQLLAWHPYGSQYESLKQRILSGDRTARLSDELEPMRRSCLSSGTIGCKKYFHSYFFYLVNDTVIVEVGVEDGRIVLLNAKEYYKLP